MAVDLKVVASQVLSTMHYLDAQKSVILAALFKGRSIHSCDDFSESVMMHATDSSISKKLRVLGEGKLVL